jgi:hypothetical protein
VIVWCSRAVGRCSEPGQALLRLLQVVLLAFHDFFAATGRAALFP